MTELVYVPQYPPGAVPEAAPPGGYAPVPEIWNGLARKPWPSAYVYRRAAEVVYTLPPSGSYVIAEIPATKYISNDSDVTMSFDFSRLQIAREALVETVDVTMNDSIIAHEDTWVPGGSRTGLWTELCNNSCLSTVWADGNAYVPYPTPAGGADKYTLLPGAGVNISYVILYRNTDVVNRTMRMRKLLTALTMDSILWS